MSEIDENILTVLAEAIEKEKERQRLLINTLAEIEREKRIVTPEVTSTEEESK
jgi:hypothetical protein